LAILALGADSRNLCRMRAYALVEFGDPEAVDLFLREEDARRALDGLLRDEPDWAGMFYVAPVELDERDVSAN
jgi:hypothetical protein